MDKDNHNLESVEQVSFLSDKITKCFEVSCLYLRALTIFIDTNPYSSNLVVDPHGVMPNATSTEASAEMIYSFCK